MGEEIDTESVAAKRNAENLEEGRERKREMVDRISRETGGKRERETGGGVGEERKVQPTVARWTATFR